MTAAATSTASMPARMRPLLAARGWARWHDGLCVRAGEPDISRILAIAGEFGEPSARDGGVPAWRVQPVTDDASATVSVRTGSAALHTDAQYRRVPEHLVCLFAVRPAERGGRTRLLPAAGARAGVARHPRGRWLARQLRRAEWSWTVPRPFTGGVPFRAPVLGQDGCLRWRADNLGPDLPGDLRAAGAEFAACVERAPGLLEMELEAGDVLIFDNRRMLHGRTSFTDRDRLLIRVRLWCR